MNTYLDKSNMFFSNTWTWKSPKSWSKRILDTHYLEVLYIHIFTKPGPSGYGDVLPKQNELFLQRVFCESLACLSPKLVGMLCFRVWCKWQPAHLFSWTGASPPKKKSKPTPLQSHSKRGPISMSGTLDASSGKMRLNLNSKIGAHLACPVVTCWKSAIMQY